MTNALVLFDIDGTLLRRAGPHHREVLVDAVRAVAGVETSTDHIPVQGMLDRDILAWMMRDGGVPAGKIREYMPAVVEKAQALYVRRCPDLQRKVCPGAKAFLARLHQAGVPLGLVTGNLTRIGWRKMKQAGLRDYFRFGAFAEMARDRAGLARMAIRQARAEGWIQKGAAIALVGDHPNDVRAARANGVRAIAVGTGVVAMEELAALEPDILTADLRGITVGRALGLGG
jgi:phosphoglycolate phosphatase-like HAD superfamily hydrolase